MKRHTQKPRIVYLAPWSVGGETVTGLFRYGAAKPELYSSSAALMARVAVAVNKILVTWPQTWPRDPVTKS